LNIALEGVELIEVLSYSAFLLAAAGAFILVISMLNIFGDYATIADGAFYEIIVFS